MRFGLSILLNKSLLVATFAWCWDMVLAVGTTLQDVFTVNLADVKLLREIFKLKKYYLKTK